MNCPPVPVSVAVCTHGRPAQLARALDSLLAQDREPQELLVIDNAPSDEAAREVVAVRGPRVRYIRERRPGLDFARNRAVAVATAPIIAFLDDDAVADRSWLGALAAAFGDPWVSACTGRVEALEIATPAQRLFEANGGFARGDRRIRLPADAAGALHGWPAPLVAWAVSVGSGCSMALRTERARGLGGFDEALDLGPALPGGGDLDMLWRILQSGGHVVYEPAALARHEHRRGLRETAAQLAGHQRALVAWLTKAVAGTPGFERLPVLAFLAWRLAKPGVRLLRRAAHADPLPAGWLWRMWWECWRGLFAYPAARATARQRRLEAE